MELNLQSTLLSKNKSTFFSTKIRNNLDIAQHFKSKVGRIIRNNSNNIIKSYGVSQILIRKDEIIIGDKGGFVLSINEKGVSHDLYRHQMQITALTQNEDDNILISGSKDEIIKIYNFAQIDDPIELIGQKEPIQSLEINRLLNRLYSGGKSGKVIVWDINTHQQLSIIETKVQNINSLVYSVQFDKLVIGQTQGIINIAQFKQQDYKLKTLKSKNSNQITCACINSPGDMVYVGSKEGMLDVIELRNNKIIKTMDVTMQQITCVEVYHDDHYLLINDLQGRIIIQNINGNDKREIRGIQKEGFLQTVIDKNEQFFYVVGIRDTIEKWDLRKENLINRFQRNETPSLENYHSFFNDYENNKFYACSQESNLMCYQINDHIQNTYIIDRTAYPVDWKIQKVEALSQQNIIYFCCQDLSIRICSMQDNKMLAKLQDHINTPIQLLYQENNNQLISVDCKGYIYIWDAKTFQVKKIHNKIQPHETLFAFLSQSQRSLYMLREDGNLAQVKINDGHVQSQKLLNDEYISSYSYNQNANQLLTGDIGGIIIQVNIKQEGKVKFKELVDMTGEIKAIAQDSKGDLMAFSTEELKIYIYSLEKQFNYDRLCSVYFEINHLFFSQNNSLLYASGPQGNLITWDIRSTLLPIEFKKLEKKHVFAMAANAWYIFLGLEDCMEVYDVESQDRIGLITDDYTRAYKLVMSFDGATLYGSHDNGGISLWDSEKFQRLVLLLPYDNSIVDFCVSEKDLFMGIYYANNHTLIYNLYDQKIFSQFVTLREMRSIKIIGDDHYVALELQSGEIGIYTMNGQIVSFVGKKSNFLKGYIESADYNYLCLIYRDATIQVWDVRKGEHIETYEKKDYIINDFCASEDRNTLYIMSNRGWLLYMNLKTGKYYKEFEIDSQKKCAFMQRFNRSVFFLSEDEPCLIELNKTMSFFQKQYIKKAFASYGRANSEKEFLRFFQIIKEEFDQSLFLQNYFNPYFSCALFNYQRALQQIQEQNLANYPILNSQNQISPLVLAIKMEHLNLAQIILIELSKNPQNVLFSNDEMKVLLNCRYEFTHKYMQYFFVHIRKFTGTNIKVPLLSKLEEPLKIDQDYKHHFTTEKYNELTRNRKQVDFLSQQDQEKLLKKVKNKLLGADAKSEVSSNTDNTSNYTYYDTNNSNNDAKVKNKRKIVLWNPTNFYRINGIYDFQQGTKESLEFLENYADSKSNEFILSNWKIIIDYKWEQIFIWLIPLSTINWAHCIFYFILMVFPDQLTILIFDYIFLIIIFIYEMVSMMVSGPCQYITSLNNIFDMIILVLCCVLNYYTYTLEGQNKEYDLDWLSALQVFSLLVVYYRALTYLRIFKQFRNVIDMLVGVAKASISLIVIVALIVVGLSVMFVKSTNSNDSLGFYLQNTINSVLGEITFETEEFGVLPWIVLVFTCIFLPVILINFLIAKISNKYTELEELEEVTSYREKAELVSEIEYFYLLRNRSKKIMQEWGSQFFDSDFTEGFTFVAKNAQHDTNQEDEGQESKLQDKFEQFQSTINNLHQSYFDDQIVAEQRKDILSGILENYNQEFQELKGQLVMVRSDTQQENDEQNKKLEILTKAVENFKNVIEKEREYDLQLQENINKQKKGFW